MNTPNLFELDAADLGAVVDVDGPATGTHAEQAARFHEANPHIYRAIVKLARYLKARGVDRWGVGAAWEILRFKALETTGDQYKLNNNYRAWYAREIMRLEQDLEGFFGTRTSPHDSGYYTGSGL